MENITEIWRDVVDFENHYEVSNMGNIRRKKSKRIRNVDFCTFYPTILLSVNGKHKTFRVHRLVAKAFCIQDDITKIHVNHIDGNKANNKADNLEWVTQSENNLHSYRSNGKISPLKGKTPANKKVVESEIVDMHNLNISGMTTNDIGLIYSIDGSTVRKHLRKYRSE